ncbi:carbohydrate kinase family protein [Wielerella bovis]|uniref:carbohydrate kinase family protein n=1 Tax=Wielerella bovis TaxID=2917790 RepID=UPI002019C513|nr:carbohydrate kinase [Wielerella bovis]MCG7657651.1 carbohydrate kinase [Wielerella bovis]MCG7659872.1 carbohydrate kinase [Wielerella bovis]
MKVSSYGEVLWDDLPSGKVLGGAPLNVVARLASFGVDASIISRCGKDADGEELLRQIAAKNVSTNLIQIDDEQATSLVKVTLNHSGSATYDIVYPCAWDKIAPNEAALARVADSDVLVYGSLVLRDAISRATLNTLLPRAKFKIFDVNLRAPHYELNCLLEAMKQADLIKLNDEELYELAAAFGSPYHSMAQNIQFIADLTKTQHICITLGGHGALYYRAGEIHAHHGYCVKVVDTVGAGDSFLAGFIYKFLQGAEPKDILTFACALGSLVASKRGATAAVSMDEILTFINPKA